MTSNRKLPGLQRDMAKLAADTAALQAKAQELVGTESELKQHQVWLEEAQKSDSALVATSAKVSAFYDELAVALDDTASDLDSTYQIARTTIDAPSRSLMTTETFAGTLQDAVLYLARHADAASRRIYVFQKCRRRRAAIRVSDVVIGTEPAGGYDHAVFVIPFKVTTPYHLRGVIIPMKGQGYGGAACYRTERAWSRLKSCTFQRRKSSPRSPFLGRRHSQPTIFPSRERMSWCPASNTSSS